MKYRFIILLAFFAYYFQLLAQTENVQKTPVFLNGSKSNNVPQELITRCDKFFKLLVNTDIDDAYNELLMNSPIIKKEEQLYNLKSQTLKAMKIYGQFTGYELVNSEFASESLIRIRYLGLHADFPMRWIITFYKSPKYGWIAVNVKLDDLTEFLFSDE